MSRNGRTLCALRQSNPTAVLIFSKQLPVSGMRQVKEQKEVGVKRVETIGVYPLAPRRGMARPPGRQVPFALQATTPRNVNIS